MLAIFVLFLYLKSSKQTHQLHHVIAHLNPLGTYHFVLYQLRCARLLGEF
jgi:hypothetical protein